MTTILSRIPRSDLASLVLKLVLLGGLIASRILWPDFWSGETLLARSLQAATFLLSAHVFIELARLALAVIYRHRRKLPRTQRDLFLLALRNIASILSLLMLVVALLSMLGIQVHQVFLAVSVIASALALIFKDYLNNGISGLIMLFSGQYALGDRISIGEVEGTLADLTMQHVHLVDRAGRHLYLPNHSVFSAAVENHSRRKHYPVEVRFTLVKAGLNLTALGERLAMVLSKESGVHLVAGSERLDILALRATELDLRFGFTIQQVDAEFADRLRQQLLRATL